MTVSLKEKIETLFGPKSTLYSDSIEELRYIFERGGARKHYKAWCRIQQKLYSDTDIQTFFKHTYLVWIARAIRLVQSNEDIKSSDIFSWIFTKSEESGKEFVKKLIKQIPPFKEVKGDVFKGLYEQIIERSARLKRGEYNTPDWLAELILNEALKEHEGFFSPRIIDTTCGAGTFIFHGIRKLEEQYGEVIEGQVAGIDSNLVAVEIAKTNYFLALNVEKHPSKIPIYRLNTLGLSKRKLSQLGQFDIVIGNPPWGSLRNLGNEAYQHLMKSMSINLGLITSKESHLFTQVESATVFFLKSLNLLKDRGVIGFVMPRSILSAAYQNRRFLKPEKKLFKTIKIFDLKDVKPLFNMPSCVLLARKKAFSIETPVPVITCSASLATKDALLDEVESSLDTEIKESYLMDNSIAKSYYYQLFKTGISIFPRSFYFIEATLNSNGDLYAETDEEILRKYTKEPWKTKLKGYIEAKFLYTTLLGWEIMPYGYKKLRLVILPIIKNNEFILLDDFKRLSEHCNVTVDWFSEANKIWRQRCLSASKQRFPTIFDRLNYNNLLKFQTPSKRFIVAYNATGRNLTACVIDRHFLTTANLSDSVTPIDFISDVKTWIFETNNLDEAVYLCGFLNSEVINKAIKSRQPRGLFGERAIHRRPLETPIPLFDPSNAEHMQISRLSLNCMERVTAIKSDAKCRKSIKEKLHTPQEQINHIVRGLLGKNYAHK